MPQQNPDELAAIIEQFAGLGTNAGVFTGPPGLAEVQRNFQCIEEGTLNVRPGLRLLSFDN